MLALRAFLVSAPYAAALQLSRASPTRLCRHSPVRMTADAEATAQALCRALQDGEAPEGLVELLSTNAGRRSFFGDYFTSDAWTCADAEEPPAALTNSICASTVETLDVILTSLLRGAATSSEPTVGRASALVDALWERVPELRASCLALADAVAQQRGEAVRVGWDQNYEYKKDDWLALLAFTTYDNAELARVSDALARCGGEGRAEAVAAAAAVDDDDDGAVLSTYEMRAKWSRGGSGAGGGSGAAEPGPSAAEKKASAAAARDAALQALAAAEAALAEAEAEG